MSHLKEAQYKDSSNFNARIYLHYKFGTNNYPWPIWVFDHIRKKERQRVLEIGCGNGLLWKLNMKKVPANWEVVLSDFSEGMLDDAKRNMGSEANNFSYQVVNVEDIPCENNLFDIIIANHMLYHVPHRDRALSEICRVLKKDGVFYATTLRRGYMGEMIQLVKEYRSRPYNSEEVNSVINNFAIENGEEQLWPFFGNVDLKIYENTLVIDEAGPFVNYVYSCNDINEKRIIVKEEEREAFTGFVEGSIERRGGITVPADFGLFICQNAT